MTVRTVSSIFRPPAEVSRMYSDSGVVTRMCGGRLTMAARSEALVSPVRTSTRISGGSMPIAASASRMPARGSLRFLRMSLLSAFRGET